jgi:hypothetical protein
MPKRGKRGKDAEKESPAGAEEAAKDTLLPGRGRIPCLGTMGVGGAGFAAGAVLLTRWMNRAARVCCLCGAQRRCPPALWKEGGPPCETRVIAWGRREWARARLCGLDDPPGRSIVGFFRMGPSPEGFRGLELPRAALGAGIALLASGGTGQGELKRGRHKSLRAAQPPNHRQVDQLRSRVGGRRAACKALCPWGGQRCRARFPEDGALPVDVVGP